MQFLDPIACKVCDQGTLTKLKISRHSSQARVLGTLLGGFGFLFLIGVVWLSVAGFVKRHENGLRWGVDGPMLLYLILGILIGLGFVAFGVLLKQKQTVWACGGCSATTPARESS